MNPTESPATTAPADTPTVARRYAAPRRLLRWRTPRLGVLKMLAWVVCRREGANTAQLWTRCRELCPHVVEAVLGESGVTLDAICEQTLAEQGAPITPAKLMQRADKTERYNEVNEYWRRVEVAYLAAGREGAHFS
jgi:hypothetical protein